MNFSGESKVKDIALFNPAARQILEEAGLDYCCGGGKSLNEACLHSDVSPDEILNRLRENSGNITREDENWITMPLCALTRHIRERHHQYVREAIRRTEPLLRKVATRHGGNHTELGGIGKLSRK